MPPPPLPFPPLRCRGVCRRFYHEKTSTLSFLINSLPSVVRNTHFFWLSASVLAQEKFLVGARTHEIDREAYRFTHIRRSNGPPRTPKRCECGQKYDSLVVGPI